MKRATDVPWVVAGGAIGEVAHCTRCGEGLIVITPRDAQLAVLDIITLRNALRQIGCALPIVAAAGKAFSSEHSHCVDRGRTERVPLTPAEWLSGRDVGVSAATICYAAFGLKSPFDREDVPHDAEDFGRCYRFVKLFGESARRGVEGLAMFQERWRGIAARWDQLCLRWESGNYAGVSAELERLSQATDEVTP